MDCFFRSCFSDLVDHLKMFQRFISLCPFSSSSFIVRRIRPPAVARQQRRKRLRQRADAVSQKGRKRLATTALVAWKRGDVTRIRSPQEARPQGRAGEGRQARPGPRREAEKLGSDGGRHGWDSPRLMTEK